MWSAVRPKWLGKVIRRSHDILVKYVNISWEFYKNDERESHKLLNFQISSKLQTRRFVICVLFSISFSAAAAKLLQSCPTLCDSTDGSPPGSPIPGILQARTLEWVAISFSNAWKWKVESESEVAQSCPTLSNLGSSRVQLCATPWTAAYQAPLSMGFSRQEYWSGVPLPSNP